MFVLLKDIAPITIKQFDENVTQLSNLMMFKDVNA